MIIFVSTSLYMYDVQVPTSPVRAAGDMNESLVIVEVKIGRVRMIRKSITLYGAHLTYNSNDTK